MNNIEAVIFDMDGVIFDTERIYLNTWEKVFKKYRYKMTKEVYTSVMGVGRKNVIKKFIKEYGEDLPIDVMYKEKDEELARFINENHVPVKKGAYELLQFLNANNYKIALATSAKRERTTKHLKDAEITDKFHAIVCGDEVTNPKPDPEIFLVAARKLGVNPKNCVVIEDSKAGLKSAYDAGMRVIHVRDLKKADDEMKKHIHVSFKNLLHVRYYLDSHVGRVKEKESEACI